MDQSISSPQHFDGAEVFGIHSLLLVLLLCAFLGGVFVAAKKWPDTEANQHMVIDLLIASPVGGFSVWLLIPRIGLAGDTIVSAYTLGNPNLLTSFLLCFAILMVFGMSFHFALPKMQATLISIGSQLLGRLGRAASAILGADGSPGGDNGATKRGR